MERIKFLCKERDSLYEKQNDLRGHWDDRNLGAWRRSCPLFLVVKSLLFTEITFQKILWQMEDFG